MSIQRKSNHLIAIIKSLAGPAISLPVLLVAALLAAATAAPAANVTWDITPGAVGAGDSTITGGAGTWDTVNGNWAIDGGANNIAWVNGNNDTAIFGGTAGTVTLGANVIVGGLSFTSSGYSIAPGVGPYKITLGAAGSTTSSTSGSIYTSSGTTLISANIDNAGFLFSRVGPGNATLSGNISGAGGLTTVYGGTTTLSGNNTYAGKTSISANTTTGSSLSISSFNSVNGGTPLLASSSLGAPTTLANGTIDIGTGGKRASCTLTYTGPGETTDRIIQLNFNSSSSQTINSSGTGLLKFTSAFQSNTTTLTGKLQLGGTGVGEIVAALPGLPTGGLAKLDSGTWTLSGANSYTGPTTISGGTLIGVVGGSSGSSTVTVNNTVGCTLGVLVNDNTKQWTCASLTSAGTNAKLAFGFGTTPSSSLAPLNVIGTLTFTGVPSVTVDSLNLVSGQSYPLIVCGGTAPSGTPTVTIGHGLTGTTSWTGNTLYLNVAGASTLPLTWAVSGSGAWDINTTANWKDNAGTADKYLDGIVAGDPVVFDDTYLSANTTVTLNTRVKPKSITIDNSSYDYTISGSGGIRGTTALLKNGSKALTLSVTGQYSGGTTVDGGTLAIASASVNALGTGDVTVNSGATLSLSNSAAIADWATLTLAAGATNHLGTGVNETVDKLWLGNGWAATGTWGGAASSATYTNTAFFTGSGMFTVSSQPQPAVVTNATVAAIGTTNAVLGATVLTDSGNPITSWGTTWSTSATGTNDNPLAVVGATNGIFTQARTDLLAGTHTYAWGWASNSGWMAFTPTPVEFYTKPDPATTPLFSAVEANEFTLSWTTNASMDGTLLLVKEGSAVDADPQDGSTYTADVNVTDGDEIGTGNYVVYAGTGSSVTVTGLTASTTYHVGIYGYAGVGALINYQTTGLTAFTNTPAVAGNFAPVINNGAGPLAVTIEEDCGTTNLQARFTLVATDDNATDTLTWTLLTAPSNGNAVVTGSGTSPNSPSTFTYEPDANFFGLDSLEVQVDDGFGGVDTIMVAITITAVNDTPVALDDAYSLPADSTLNVPVPGVLTNDTDVDGDTLTAVKLSDPADGVLSLNANGSFTYTPDNGWFGIDTFTYGASDGVATSAAATVTINVLGPLYWDASPGTADGTSQGGAGTWNTATANWDDGVGYQVWNNAYNLTAILGGSAGTVTLATGITVGGLTFQTAGYTITADTLTFGAAGIITNAGTATISSVIAGGAGATITKSGNGTLILSGANTYPGDTVIDAGTLQIGNNGTSATLGGGNYAGNIINNGTLDIQTAAHITLSGNISGSGPLLKRSSGKLTLSGNNTYTGKTSNGAITNPGGAGTLEVYSFNSVNNPVASSSLGRPTTVANGTIEMGSGNSSPNPVLRYIGTGETTDRVINIIFNSGAHRTLDASGSGLLKFTSAFTGGDLTTGVINLQGTGAGELVQGLPFLLGPLNKSGTGTWTLGGAVGNTGLLTVSAGTLALQKKSSLMDGLMSNWTAAKINVKSGATLALNVDSDETDGISSASLDTLLTAISVANTAAQGLQSGAKLAFDTSTATGGTFTQGNVLANSTGANGGTIHITKLGTGTLILDEANTYTGTTSINGGTLQLGAGGASGSLSTSSAISVASGTVFAVNQTDTVTQGTEFSGAAITGAGGLTQAGSGTNILNVANAYTGPTTVSAGTLVLGAANAISGSSQVVLAGGTLDVGNFSPVLGTLNVAGNSTIALGSGNMSFADSSGVAWSDGMLLTLTGTLGATTLQFGSDPSALDAGQVALIRYEGGGVHLDSNGYVVSNPRGSVIRFR